MEVGMTSLLVPRAGGHWCWVGKEAIPVRRLAGKPAGDLEVEAGHVPQVVEVAATEVCFILYQLRRSIQHGIMQWLATL